MSEIEAAKPQASPPLAEGEVGRWDLETDVLVVGLGATGASAAIEAREAGASVQVIERGWRGGGTSAESTAQFYLGGGTPLQKACGFDDDPEEMYKYLVASCGPGVDEAKIRHYSDSSVDHYHWLTGHGIHFEMGFVPYEVSTHPGPGQGLSFTGSERAHPFCEVAKPAPRGHTVLKDGQMSGEFMMQVLMGAAKEAGAQIQPDTDAERLVVDGDGAVVGVVARFRGERQLLRARRGVVLTTGGFAHNEEMLRRYAPALLGHTSPIGPEIGDDGSGIRMGMGAGGAASAQGSRALGVVSVILRLARNGEESKGIHASLAGWDNHTLEAFFRTLGFCQQMQASLGALPPPPVQNAADVAQSQQLVAAAAMQAASVQQEALAAAAQSTLRMTPSAVPFAAPNATSAVA